MNRTDIHGKLFMNTAILVMLFAVLFGCLASASYIWPGFLKEQLGFVSMRPLHVSAALFWILLGGTACVFFGLNNLFPEKMNPKMVRAQWALWMIALLGIAFSFFTGRFGGREYWEFEPIWALPIALAWILFIIQFFQIAGHIKQWPVYMWMWMTGIVFFMFIFIENYLWIFPYFRNDLIADMTIQWKVSGSIVGAWNQILYGSAFYLMDKISGNEKVGHSRTAFIMYFIGLFNLMFNWGHHVYTLPTEPYVRYLGYLVSMTEWIFFAKTIYNWKSDLSEIKKHYHYFPYRFIMASNFWVFLNLFQALLMSIPAINLYTHGTHITVAHAMGTTIGINSMIILAAGFMHYSNACYPFENGNTYLKRMFWALQFGLLIFWISLNIAGIQKGLWQLDPERVPYAEMMKNARPMFIVFFVGGLILTVSFAGLTLKLLQAHFFCKETKTIPLEQKEIKSNQKLSAPGV